MKYFSLILLVIQFAFGQFSKQIIFDIISSPDIEGKLFNPKFNKSGNIVSVEFWSGKKSTILYIYSLKNKQFFVVKKKINSKTPLSIKDFSWSEYDENRAFLFTERFGKQKFYLIDIENLIESKGTLTEDYTEGIISSDDMQIMSFKVVEYDDNEDSFLFSINRNNQPYLSLLIESEFEDYFLESKTTISQMYVHKEKFCGLLTNNNNIDDIIISEDIYDFQSNSSVIAIDHNIAFLHEPRLNPNEQYSNYIFSLGKSDRKSKLSDLYLIDVSNGNKIKKIAGPLFPFDNARLSYHYSVHPNKPYVFFINSLFEIVAYNYITDSEVIIDTNTYNNTHLTLSQDGNKIAFIGLNVGETSSNNTLFIGKIKL